MVAMMEAIGKDVDFKVVNTKLEIKRIKATVIVSRETIQIHLKDNMMEMDIPQGHSIEVRTNDGLHVLVNKHAQFIDCVNRYPEFFGENVFRVISTNFNKKFPQIGRIF